MSLDDKRQRENALLTSQVRTQIKKPQSRGKVAHTC